MPETGEFDYKVIAINNSVPSLPSNIARVTVTEASQIALGENLYLQQCAGCHGNNAEGSSHFPTLNSERDLNEMIAYIVTAMPLENPAACDQQCAENIAAFIQTLWVPGIACTPGSTPGYGPRQIKVLTQSEYQHSVEDLLGVDFRVSNGLSADTKMGLFTNTTRAAIVDSSYSNYLLVAEEIAQWSANRDVALALSCSSFDQSCATEFIDNLAPNIFRRPLSDEEILTYTSMANGTHTGGNIKQGIQMALEGMLSSPQFLYRHELGEANPDNPDLDSDVFELTSYEMATFLAYTFTGSTPDQQLLDAAARNELRIEAEIIRHAQRLVDNASPVMNRFVGSWLGTANLDLAAKDPDIWPGFAAVVPDMQQEINATFSSVMLEPNEEFSSLYSGNFTFLNQNLAEYYGTTGITGDAMQRVNTQERGGILANGAFMSRWGESIETSPILRSVRVRRRMLCQQQVDPPAGTFAAREQKLAELSDFLQDSATTNRMKYHRLTEDTACASCHEQYINPLGFDMEDFDSVGRIRDMDLQGNSIDANGKLYAPLAYADINTVETFNGTKELSTVLANLESAQRCLPEQLFSYFMGVGDQAIDNNNPEVVQFSDEETTGYACAIDQLTDTMMNDSPRSMLESFSSLKTVRYRKAWSRN